MRAFVLPALQIGVLLLGLLLFGSVGASVYAQAPAAEADTLSPADSLLIRHAREGNVDGVREALTKGGDPNVRFDTTITTRKQEEFPLRGLTPLFIASDSGAVEVLPVLAEAGAMLDARVTAGDEFKLNALHEGVLNGDSAVVHRLLDLGADPNAPTLGRKNAESWQPLYSPLIAATTQEYPRIVDLLLAAGADVSAESRRGNTALDVALRKQYSEIIRRLLQEGAPADASLTSALGRAVRDERAELVKMLIDAGANPAAAGASRYPPLIEAIQNKDTTTVRVLLEAITDPNDRAGNSGKTPLHYAASNGLSDVVRLLLDRGADPTIRTDERSKGLGRETDGRTALDVAFENDHADVIEILLGAYSDESEALRWAFFRACREGHSGVVRVLLDKGIGPQVHPENRYSAFTRAVQKGHLEIVRMLLDAGISLGLKGEREVPIQSAAAHGRVDVLRFMLDQGADPNTRDSYGNTALMWAAGGGHVQAVQVLLDAGAKVQVRGHEGKSPLYHAAASEGGTEVIRRLLEAGARIDATDNHGKTPLYVAADEGRADKVRLLLEHAASPNVRVQRSDETYHQYHTPLYAAVEQGHAAIVKALLDGGADPDARIARQLEDIRITGPLSTAVRGEHTTVVRHLLDAGAAPNLRDSNGGTPLMYAAARDPGLIQMLLDAGADPNLTNDYGEPGLNYAAVNDRFEAARLLVEAGADLEHRDEDDLTPLMIAVYHESPNVTRVLLQDGANPRAHESEGRSLLDIAQEQEHPELARLLKKHGAGDDASGDHAVTLPDSVDTSLHDAAKQGSVAVVREKLDAMSPDVRSPEGTTPLMAAAEHGRATVVEVLLDAGADPNAQDDGGHTPLVKAATEWQEDEETDDPTVMAHLMEAGANPNVANEEGETPLYQVVSEAEAVAPLRQLLDAGADPNRQEALGWKRVYERTTALNEAVKDEENQKAVQILLEAGANPDARVANNATPLMTAVQEENPPAVEALLDAGADRSLRDNDGLTAFDHALRTGPAPTAVLWREGQDRSRKNRAEDESSQWEMLMAAVAQGDAETVRSLLQDDVDVNRREHGHTPLLWAARTNHVNVGRHLLRAGAATDEMPLYEDQTPLMVAAKEGHTAFVRFLLKHGADPNIVAGPEKNTALIVGAEEGQTEVVRALLEAGADPFHENEYGNTARDEAERNDHDVQNILEQAMEK